MNTLSFADFNRRLENRLRCRTRLLDLRRRADVFSRGEEPGALRRIYVINLDRKPDRWRRQRRELDRFRERHGQHLSMIARRFSAVDARYLDLAPDASTLHPTFTLADQLTVDPNPRLQIDDEARARVINMTQQEVAVALSHIGVWRLIANGDVPSALVLEDDVFFARGFVPNFQTTWSTLTSARGEHYFDLLYLAYRDLHERDSKPSSQPKRRLAPGVWEASGYVLTRRGARELLSKLPAYGPIDLWLNLQFADLRVFTAAKHLIEQRIDEPSTNSYSVLPVLSQVGVMTREKPLVHASQRLVGPIIAVGPKGSGLTALAKALSMLGYTCLSDLVMLPHEELQALETGRKDRSFNAYVNIGSFEPGTLRAIASTNPGARFIVTSPDCHLYGIRRERLLRLGHDINEKWAALSEFLKIEYPPFPYPGDEDLGQRPVADSPPHAPVDVVTNLRFDVSPWVLRSDNKCWRGVRLDTSSNGDADEAALNWTCGDRLDNEVWLLRDDTFPSNLALFTPANFSQRPGAPAALTFREEVTSVRRFTSAAIASRERYLYGSFGAELRPSNVPGLITGLFLHRNGPRQEIDIEFLGRDTTKMLVNIYYNPGPDGTKLEYGYRGTPTEIRLGFDASTEFHAYEIEWHADVIRWKVDGAVVYERLLWNPTPIPDQPLEFNVNLWHSRSTKLAGRLATTRTPAMAEIRSIQLLTSQLSCATENRDAVTAASLRLSATTQARRGGLVGPNWRRSPAPLEGFHDPRPLQGRWPGPHPGG